MSDITFQKVTTSAEDIQKYLEIELTAADDEKYSGIFDEVEAQEEMEKNEVYFILADGQTAGSTEYEIISPDEVYLSGLIIKPEFQGQGIARTAIEFRLDKVKDKKRVWLVTHPNNSKIIKLYESYGFKIEGRKENYFGDGEPRLVLVRQK